MNIRSILALCAMTAPQPYVRPMAMPHLMFYAPHVTNDDIGATPDLEDQASLMYPFIDRQGNGEQSYMIQMVGQAEEVRILAVEQALIGDLCAYRDVLCLRGVDSTRPGTTTEQRPTSRSDQ